MTSLTTVDFSQADIASNPVPVNKTSLEIPKGLQVYLKVQSTPHLQNDSPEHNIKEHLFFRLITLNCKNLKHAEIEEDILLIKNAIANLLIVNSLLIQKPDLKEKLDQATIEVIKKIIKVYKLSSSQLQSKKTTTTIQQLCRESLSLYKGNINSLNAIVTYSSTNSIETLKNIKTNLLHFISLYEFQTDFFNGALKNKLTKNHIKVFFIQDRINLYLEKLNSLNKKILNLSKKLDTMIHKTHVTFEDTLFLSAEFDKISKNMLFPFFEDDHFSLFTSTNPFFSYSDLFSDNDLKEKFEKIYPSYLSLVPELVQNKDEALIQFYNTFFINLCHCVLKNSIKLLIEQLQLVVTQSAMENNLTLNVKAAIDSLKTFKAMSSTFKKAKISNFDKNINEIHSIINTWIRDPNPLNNYTGLLFNQCSRFKIGMKHALKILLNDQQNTLKKLDLIAPHDFSQPAMKAYRTRYLESTVFFNNFYRENCKPTIEKIDHFLINFLKKRENTIPPDTLKGCVESTKKESSIENIEKSKQRETPQIELKSQPALKLDSTAKEPELHKESKSKIEKTEDRAQQNTAQNSKKIKKAKEHKHNKKYRTLLSEAQKQGWVIKRTTGDHIQLKISNCPQAGTATLPKHDNLKLKTVINFQRQIKEGNAIAQTAPKNAN